MKEVTNPIIAIALVLVAVFVPLAFISGLSGQFYKQFAMTIAISTVISADQLADALACARRAPAQSHAAPKDRSRGGERSQLVLPRLQHSTSAAASHAYSRGVGGVLSRKTLMFGVYLTLLALTRVLFKAVPSGFVPEQDKQYLIGFAQLPDGATLDRTEEVMRRMGEIMMKQPGVENAVGFPGAVDQRLHQQLERRHRVRGAGVRSLSASSRELQRRRDRRAASTAVRHDPGRVHRHLPAAAGAGPRHRPAASRCTSRTGRLSATKRSISATKASSPRRARRPNSRASSPAYQVNVPQLYADVDRTKARQLGVP